MGEELDPAIIQKTQESLGKLIKKPTLTDKLLRKPPFKFLHDIITSVIGSTGFLQGLYTDDELLSENIKERESKIAFLQKAIDHVVSVTGVPLKIRPTKTVAGHEAGHTNEFLQALSKAITLSNNNLIDSPAIKSKSLTKSSTKKSEKKDSNEHKKSDNKEKQQKASVSESPKASSSKSRSTDKAKQEKSSKTDSKKVDKDPGKRTELKEAAQKSDPESGKKKTSSKSSSHNKDNKPNEKEKIKNNEINEKERSKSRERSQNKTKSKTTTSDEKNKIRRESKDTGRSKDKIITKDPKKISKQSSPEKKVNVSSSPEKSPEKKIEEVIEDINDVQQINGSVEPQALLLGSEEMANGVGEIDHSEQIPKPSPGGASVMRTATRRPPTGLPQNSKKLEGVATNYAEEPVAVSTDLERQVNGQEKGTERPSTSTIRRSSARPATARPAAPRVRVVDSAPEDTPSQEAANPVSNIIMDGAAAPDVDEDDGFVVEEPAVLDASEEVLIKNGTSVKDLEGKTHGSLVTQIIETSKDLENGSRHPGVGFKRVEVDKSLLSDTSRRKDREVFSREMDKLRESVQTLTKSANPLGKLIDYLQEDVDTMFKELEMWSAERRRHEIALQMEESKTDLNLENLYNKLQGVEENIEDQMAKISAVKANIIRNEERVQKMVATTRM